MTEDGEQADRAGLDTPDDTAPEQPGPDRTEPADTAGGGAASGEAGTPVDRLPDDLQPHLVDPDEYVFPNNNRRRVPGYLYLAIALGLALLVLLAGDSVFVNRGLLGAAAVLAAFGAYSLVSGWNLDVDERDALVAAIAAVGFPVGHASAQMGWRGLLSRPTWRVLLYSAEEPPEQRGFALIDGVDGSVVDSFVEVNPEDWSDIDGV